MGTPIPNRDVEYTGNWSGEARTVTLPEHEMERLRALTNRPEKKDAPKYEMTRDEYLARRVTGRTRRDIQIENFGNHGGVMKGFLTAWGLLDPAVEREEVDKLRPPDQEPPAVQKQPKTKQAADPKVDRIDGRKTRAGKYAHITKAFVQAEFKKGKTVAQIEHEQHMSKNSLFYYLKKWEIRSPHSPGTYVKPKRMREETPSQQPEAGISFTPEEIALLKTLRSLIDKVVAAHG